MDNVLSVLYIYILEHFSGTKGHGLWVATHFALFFGDEECTTIYECNLAVNRKRTLNNWDQGVVKSGARADWIFPCADGGVLDQGCRSNRGAPGAGAWKRMARDRRRIEIWLERIVASTMTKLLHLARVE
jgi:hypothetical protein